MDDNLPVGDAGDGANDIAHVDTTSIGDELPVLDMVQQMKERGKKEQEIHEIIVK